MNNTSKTGLLYSVGLGLLTTPLYLVFAWGISGELEQPIFPVILSSGLIVLEYLYAALSYTSQGHKPQIVGFGQLEFKVTQAITGIAMISVFTLGLSMAASFTVSLLILAKLLKADFAQPFPFRSLLYTGSKILLPTIPLSILPIGFPIERLDTLWVLLPLLILHILIYFSAYFGLLYALMPKFRSTLDEARRSFGLALRSFSSNMVGDRSQENLGRAPAAPTIADHLVVFHSLAL